MNNTAATMDAAASVDSDMEKALWSETPETNYFKMMMEDNTDDSVLGGETLASIMGDVKGKKPNSSSKSKYSTMSVDSYSVTKDAGPAETMSIVGLEDDISTIANDTVNETTKAFFSGNNEGRDSKPRIRLFKEYKTPPKAKKRSESSTEDAGDEETAPETPPGMIQVHGKSKNGDKSVDESAKAEKDETRPVRSKRVYIVAGVLAIVLFASIIALSLALSGIRGDGSTTTSTSSASSENGGSGGVLDDWPELNSTINGPSNPPLDGGPSEPPVITTEPPTDETATTAPPTPQDTPASSPSQIPVDANFDGMLSILEDRGAVSTNLRDNPDSPQYQALTWLSGDPSYSDYTEDRAVQRWALATFALSLEPASGGGTRRRAQTDILPGWLEYTDECTWFTSSVGPVCNPSGMYESLDVQNLQLYGNLPTEIALLSNSLRTINLDGNSFQGRIPAEYGNLSLLETLRLRLNDINGTIPTELSLLSNLKSLALGRNKLTGSIPPEVVSVLSLTNFTVDFNYLAGEIPKEIGNLVNLMELRLNDNSFTGKIPGQIANLDNLAILALENNGLTGDLPKNVCSLSNLAVIRLDCDAIGCDCCAGCSAGPPDPMTVPTSSPTIPGTASPTVCSDAVNVFSTCFAVGDDIIASFSNCNPQVDDWVGLFPSTENFSDLPNPSIWSWACGSRNCREAVTSNTIALNADLAGNSDWPPTEGTYRVVIARNSAQPYAAFAVSGEFTISSAC